MTASVSFRAIRKLVLRRKVIIDAHYGEIRLRGQNAHDSVVGIEVAHDKTATMEVDQTRQCLFLSRADSNEEQCLRLVPRSSIPGPRRPPADQRSSRRALGYINFVFLSQMSG